MSVNLFGVLLSFLLFLGLDHAQSGYLLDPNCGPSASVTQCGLGNTNPAVSCGNLAWSERLSSGATFQFWECRCITDGIISGQTIEGCPLATSQTGPSSGPGPTNNSGGGCGSFINIDNLALSESVPIVGANFSLVYWSDRVGSREGDYKVSIPITNSSPETELVGIELKVYLEDNPNVLLDTQNFNDSADQVYDFTWDGLVGGNPFQGTRNLFIQLTETFSDSRTVFPTMQKYKRGNWNVVGLGLGGWAPSTMHFFDNGVGQKLLRSNGNIESKKLLYDGTYWGAIDSERNEIYQFETAGSFLRHKKTIHYKTGGTLVEFSYDGSGRLSSITDAHSNVTTFNRDGSGNLTSIDSPYNQTTNITLNGDGFISEIENPNSESHLMTYYTGTGLLNTFETPKGVISTFSYDARGFLTQDTSSRGNSLSYSYTPSGSNISIQQTTAEGLVSSYTVSSSSSGDSRNEYHADGTFLSYGSTVGSVTNMTTDETSNSQNVIDDDRFSTYNERIFSSSTTYSGKSALSTYMTYGISGGVGFSYSGETVTYSTNSKATTADFTKSTGVTEYTSPEGRKDYVTINTAGQTTSIQHATFDPFEMTYDGNGRLWKIENNTRLTEIAYNADGFVDSITNALSEVTSFTYDGAGRVLTQTLPDTRVVTYTYDADGNVASITPPSSQTHTFLSTIINWIIKFFSPVLGVGQNNETEFAYNDDRKIEQITKPNGDTINYNYHTTTGLLTSVSIPGASYSFSHTGKNISQATSPDSIRTSVDYYGPYPYKFSYYDVGNSADLGSVETDLNADYMVSMNKVTGSDTVYHQVDYTYDNDNLLTEVGDLDITRNSTTGYISGTELNKISDAYTYNANYGEVATYNAYYNPVGSPQVLLFSQTYTRDALGRITTKAETIGGVSATYDYDYDTAGRLVDVNKNSSAHSDYTYDGNSDVRPDRVPGSL